MEDIISVVLIFGLPFAVIGVVALGMYLKHQAAMFDRKLFAQSQISGQTSTEIAALRQELAQLRDTSTQYDVSLQQSLEELQHRVATIEARNRNSSAPVAEDQQVAVGKMPR
jgi:hypothetical protein